MEHRNDWDPRADAVQIDQISAYDELRQRCPVAHSDFLGWSLLNHHDAMTALLDHEVYSSQVSRHVAVPNGMDPPEHTAYRAIIDRCFTAQFVDDFAPALRRLAEDLIPAALELDIMADLALPYAARAQCAYLGWPQSAATALQTWAEQSAPATLRGDREELERVAKQFDEIIVENLRTDRPGPVITGLRSERVAGQPLTDAQIVSIVRNWTAGELGTIAAAVGIIVGFLAQHPQEQQLLRERPALRQPAMDEILRLDAPLIADRRRTAVPVTASGRDIPADEPVTILWPAVQRDPARFDAADQFRLDRDPRDNLLYGRGVHYCPGEGLARLELGVFLDEFLHAIPAFELVAAQRAGYPSGGFRALRVRAVSDPV
ncbi:MAG: cytochrome P450 [Candidatus Nanopelagicales bacterium]